MPPSLAALLQPYSAGTTDPFGYVMSYVPVALALVAMIIAFMPAVFMAFARLRERRSRTGASPMPRAQPSTA